MDERFNLKLTQSNKKTIDTQLIKLLNINNLNYYESYKLIPKEVSEVIRKLVVVIWNFLETQRVDNSYIIGKKARCGPSCWAPLAWRNWIGEKQYFIEVPRAMLY